MTEMDKRIYCSDHEVLNNNEKLDEETSKDESYHLLMSSITSSYKAYTNSSLDVALREIINKRTTDAKSSTTNKESPLKICKKSLYLTKNHIDSWINTGYLPYLTVSDRLNSTQLYDNNSFNCSSVDTTTYILSNTKAKIKDETMVTIVNTKSSSQIPLNNTLHENTLLEKDETQNMHANLNLSISNKCDSSTKHTKNNTEENNINNENNSTLEEGANNESFSNLKRSGQKKLYTPSDSPIDIIVAKSKNNIVIETKNLHPALTNSPPQEKSSKKLFQKRRSKSAINYFRSESFKNIANNLEKNTCTREEENILVDIQGNLTKSQYSIPNEERLHQSCKALIEQLKRFPTSDYINNINIENEKLRERKLRTNKNEKEKPKTNEVAKNTCNENISVDSEKILQEQLKPYVILKRLPEEIIQNYIKKKMVQSPEKKLMETNKINNEDTCNNNSNIEKFVNSFTSTVLCFENDNDSIDSDATTIHLSDSNDVLITSSHLKSNSSHIIVNPSHSLNPGNLNNELNKDLNKDLDDQSLKFLQPMIVANSIKIKRTLKDSNDTEKSETSVKRVSTRNKRASKHCTSCTNEFSKRKSMKKSLTNISSNTDFIKTINPIVKLTKSKDLTNLKTNRPSSREDRSSKLISSDSKLSKRPIVKLKRLSFKYSVKSVHKNNNKRYKGSIKNDNVQVKRKRTKSRENNRLSLNSSNLKRMESPKQRVRKRRSTTGIKRLPMFFTRDEQFDHRYSSDSDSNSDSNLNKNQTLIKCIFNFYKDEKNHKEKRTITLNDKDMAKSINQLKSSHTNMNTSIQTRSCCVKNLSILRNVGNLLNKTTMDNVESNICSTSNKLYNTRSNEKSRKNKSTNEKGKSRLIVNKMNRSRKNIFSTKTYETDSDSSNNG